MPSAGASIIAIELKTPRLLLTPFSERHLTERYLSWLNDDMLMRYSEQRHRSHTLEDCRRYMESMHALSSGFWAIETADLESRYIGTITAHLDLPNNRADVGILIGAQEARGEGYGFEAWQAVCDFLIRDVGIRKVTAGTMAANKGMLAIMEKAGMVEDGRRRRHLLLDGAEMDVICRAIFREDWLRRYPRGSLFG